MTDEVRAYFIEQYKKAPFRMLPGDLPNNFHSKEDVDSWIETFSKLRQYALKYKGCHVEDNDDF